MTSSESTCSRWIKERRQIVNMQEMQYFMRNISKTLQLSDHRCFYLSFKMPTDIKSFQVKVSFRSFPTGPICQLQTLPGIWCAASRCCEIVVWGCGMWWSLANPFTSSGGAAGGHSGALSSGPRPVHTGSSVFPGAFHNRAAKLATRELTWGLFARQRRTVREMMRQEGTKEEIETNN